MAGWKSGADGPQNGCWFGRRSYSRDGLRKGLLDWPDGSNLPAWACKPNPRASAPPTPWLCFPCGRLAQVAVNEDPRSRLIRELREEVTFLRQQLEAAGAGAGVGTGADAAAVPDTAPRIAGATAAAASGGGGGGGARGAGASAAPGKGGVSGQGRGAVGAVGGLAAADEDEEAVAKRLRTSDVEVRGHIPALDTVWGYAQIGSRRSMQ